MKYNKRNLPPNYLAGAYEAADAGLKAREDQNTMRYFIIYFTMGSGSAGNFTAARTGYPNRFEIRKWVSENHGCFIHEVVTTSIQELTESDYNDWIKTEE